MKLRHSIVLLFCLSVQILFGQQYGNEWVDVNKDYYKFKVLEDGMYRVSYDELVADGVPVDGGDISNFQLWYRGQQVSLKIEGDDNGVFEAGESFVFYGERADALEEIALYDDPSYQVNKDYSLYSDTSFYFFTTGSSNAMTESVTSSDNGNYLTDFEYRDVSNYHYDYSRGEEPIDYVFRSEFDKGEGWMTAPVGYRTGVAKNFYGEYVYLKGDRDIALTVEFVGRNKHQHVVDITVGQTAPIRYEIQDFSGYDIRRETVLLDNSVKEDGRLLVRVYTYSDGTVDADLIAVASYEVKSFSDQLDVTENHQEFFITGSAGQQFRMKNSNTDKRAVFDVTDISNVIEEKGLVVGDSIVFNITNNGRRRYVFADSSNYRAIDNIEKVKPFVNDLKGADYLILTHEDFKEGAEQYKAYRESQEGGNHNVHLVDLERVLDQYAYGEKNPLAVRRLIAYLIDNGQKPDYFFIIGDGSKHNNQNGSKPFDRELPFMATQANGELYYANQDYVFTYGEPGWDMGFSAGLDGNDKLVPAVPTGRLAARLNADVISYLNKVKEHESQENIGLWRKRGVHLSGGRNAGEHQQFLNFVKQWEGAMNEPLIGGDVTTYSKKSTDVVEFFNISQEVNEGVGIVSYIGHSSPTYIEVDIGTASEDINGYKNKGKYPLLFLNGCTAGDIFSSRSRAQDWLNTPDRGAIAALAHVSYGYSGELHNYCESYYEKAYNDSLWFSESIGNVQLSLIKEYLDSGAEDAIVQTQAQQMFLLGDPAIVLFPDTTKDYAIERVNVSDIQGERVTAALDSFLLEVVISNYGRATQDSLMLCIERSSIEHQSTQILSQLSFAPVYYQDTIQLVIYNDTLNDWSGLNEFIVTVNCGEGDYRTDNDTYIFRYDFPENGLNNIFPLNYELLGDSSVTFVFESHDDEVTELSYNFELSTDASFDQPLVQIDSSGASVIELMNIELPLVVDTATFYWRTKIKDDTVWTNSSFTFIEGKSGMGQFQFDQMKQNDQTGLVVDEGEERWSFEPLRADVIVNSAGNAVANFGLLSNMAINGQSLVVESGRGGCVSNGVHIVTIDKGSMLPYYFGGLDAANCGQKPRITYSLASMNSESSQNKLIAFLHEVPEGDYIVMITSGSAYIDSWGDSLKTVLQDFGATKLNEGVNGVPYVFIGQNGGSGILEEHGESNLDSLSRQITILGNSNSGVLTSPLLGPASSWVSYEDEILLNAGDELEVSLYGVNALFEDSLLWSSNMASNFVDLANLGVNDEGFTYVRLSYELKDTLNFDPAQLDFWNVQYLGAPEGKLSWINRVDVGNAYDEGDTVKFVFQFDNISRYDFTDSLEVEFQLIGSEDNVVWTEKIPAIEAGGTHEFSYLLNTSGYSGELELQVFVNPFISNEQDYGNNQAQANLEITRDEEHPVLSVLVNGQHIADGQWLLNEPLITASLTDNNKIYPASDTANFFVYFKSPCESCDFERIRFNDERIAFNSATGMFDVTFKPGVLVDGVYVLRVYAFDISGNRSGANPYEISFEIRSNKEIVASGAYPNPATEEVLFNFDISGGIPSDLQIQIFNAQGKFVRTLNIADSQRFEIGENGGRFSWQCDDEFGAKVAKGLYIFSITGGSDFSYDGDKKGRVLILR